MGCSQSNTQELEWKNRKQDTTASSTKIFKESDIKINNNILVQGKTELISKNYKITSKIGSGTFGKVFKVKHLPTSNYRAMKVVKKDTVNYQDDEKVFLKEIEILSQLDHINIIKIFEYYVDDLHYYVMSELATGGELYEQIYKIKNYSEMNAAIIMEQLLSAVNYIHQRGIVHRDLKPENILLETKGTETNIKIIDFGTSNFCKEKEKLSLKVGTPYYIAPEVLKKEYNHMCDIWSLGVIMYILLSGTPPFDGNDDTQIMDKVLKGKFSFAGKEWEKISDESKDLLTKLLTYDYKNRITALEAKEHPWIVKWNSKKRRESTIIPNTVLKKPFENLRKFGAKQKLQQSTIAFLVRQVSNTSLVKNLKEIFQKLDENNDGTLSYDEIKLGFKKYYKDEQIAEKEMEEILYKLDQDNNNCIEYEEFIRCTVDLESLLTDSNLKIAFQAFDKDNSGELTPDEIKSALGIIDSDNDVIKNIISEIDENSDGVISYTEFKELMIKVIKSSDNIDIKKIAK